jgi:hypothetical protein
MAGNPFAQTQEGPMMLVLMAYLLGGGGMGLLVASLPRRQGPSVSRPVGHYRPCPSCAESIRVEAVKCRYCQSDLTAHITSVEKASHGEEAPPASWALMRLPDDRHHPRTQEAAGYLHMLAAAGYAAIKLPTGWEIVTSSGRVVQTVETLEGLERFAQMVHDKGVFWHTNTT